MHGRGSDQGSGALEERTEGRASWLEEYSWFRRERKLGKLEGAFEAEKRGLHLIRRTMVRPLAGRGELVKVVGEKEHFLPPGKVESVLFLHA